MKPLLAAMVALLVSGCGFFKSGSWENDPKNWERAYGEKAPTAIVVHRSYYERMPHPVFKEFAYFFEIDDSSAARSYLGFGSVLKKTPSRIRDVDFLALRDSRAVWFPNGDSSGDFEVWRPQDTSLYAVLVDVTHKRLFITDRM